MPRPEPLCPGAPRLLSQLSEPLEASKLAPSQKLCVLLSRLCFPTLEAPPCPGVSPGGPSPAPPQLALQPPLGHLRQCPLTCPRSPELISYLWAHRPLPFHGLLQQFPGTAKTKHHKLGDFEQETFILSRMWRLEVQDQGLIWVTLILEASGENLFLAPASFWRCGPAWLPAAVP